MKDGVEPKNLWIAAACSQVADILGQTVTVSEGFALNTGHMVHSKHYTNEALDIRTFDIPKERWNDVVGMLKHILGPDYDVILESNHIHAEYDPKIKKVIEEPKNV